MRKSMITGAIALALAFTLPAGAADHGKAVKIYELKDGTTLFIYQDGKMSMEDKVGRPLLMKEGVQMETKDGQVIMMKGNEIWRREELKPRG